MSRRWIGWHLFCIALVVVLVSAGAWQWIVAMASTGPDGESNVNIRNLVYAMQWWVFAIFGVWFWLRFLRDQRDADREEAAMADAELDGGVIAAASGGDFTAPSESAFGVRSETSTGDPQISLDDSADVRRERSRAAMRAGADTSPAATAPSPDVGSDSVTPSDLNNRTATER
jgi:hypothetical protein